MNTACFSCSKKATSGSSFWSLEKQAVFLPGFSFPSGLDLENTNFLSKQLGFIKKKQCYHILCFILFLLIFILKFM
jgi:hypothetical protein